MHHIIYVTAGGTGGHLFPALALIQTLIKAGDEVVFVTDAHGAAIAVDQRGLVTHTLPLRRRGRGKKSKFLFVLSLIKSFYHAWRLLAHSPPQLVVGFGGYPSFPLIAAAFLRGIPFVLHEQNAYVGKVNRWLAPWAKFLATSFSKVNGLKKGFNRAKIIETGNMVRADIQALHHDPYMPPGPGEKFHLLVLGGSQGAAILSTVIPEGIKLLPASYRARLEVVQQSRPEFLETTRAQYASMDVKAKVEVFFHDMAFQYQKAHFVISRSGASTVSEVMVAGRPCLLIPYLHAMDDHQYFNALELVRTDGAFISRENEISPKDVMVILKDMMDNPMRLTNMSKALKKMAQPAADKALQRLLYKTINQLPEGARL